MAESCCNAFQGLLERQSKVSYSMQPVHENVEKITGQFLETLYDTKKNTGEVRQTLCGIFLANNWKPRLAESIFESLQEAIKSARAMGDALQTTFNEVVRVTDDVAQFGNDSLIRHEVIALGVLVLLSPGVTEAMGFKEEEITRGMRLLSLFNIASLPDC